jgi:ribosome biogenesis protein Nip4
MSVMNKELQILKLKDFVKSKGLDSDTIDFEAEVDSSLAYFENKKHIVEMLNLTEDLSKKQVEVQTQQIEKENLLKVEEIVREETSVALNKIANQGEEFLLPQLQNLCEGVKMVARGHFNGLFCVSNGGFGKSFSVIQTLAREKIDYELINTHISPVALVEYLYNNNGKVILFEDCEKILENEVIVSILRSALWSALVDEKGEMVRTITFNSAWEKAEHLPKKFIFTGKIILLANKMPTDSRIEALLSRVLLYNLHFSLLDVKKMFVVMAKKGYKDVPANTCLEIINKLSDKVGVEVKNLNLRLFHKAVELYRYNKDTWVSAVDSFLDIDEDLKFVGELIKSNNSVNVQAEEFTQKTGKSRRTFFTLKKKYLHLLGSDKK